MLKICLCLCYSMCYSSCYIPCFSAIIHNLNCWRTEVKKSCSDEEAANFKNQLKYLLAKPLLVLHKCNLSK